MLHSYTWRDTVLYALGVGAKLPGELAFLDNSQGPRVLPTFAVVPSFNAMLSVCNQLGADMAMVVHGEQTVTLHRPIPAAGTFATTATVTGIYDKGKGAVAQVSCTTTSADGAPVFENLFSIFVRGAGGFGGDRGPEAPAVSYPDRAPAFAVTETTTAEQAALYRLSGDENPLHISPAAAAAVGFPQPSLHGLCTYGFAGRAVLAQACAGDVTRFASFSARFSAPVLPGETLTTEGWRTTDQEYVVRVKDGAGKIVLANGRALVKGA